MDDQVERLATVVFHEKLGTLRQKVGRIVSLAEYIGKALHYSEAELAQTKRAAYLAKADLQSRVVYEFPELQGIMGEYYAQAAGEDAEVAQAIREHYLPRFAGDALPETKAGIAVALADKMDSIAAFFAIGQIPSGSADPFALRRAASGCTQIIVKNELPLRLREVLPYALDLLKLDVPELDRGKLGESLENVVNFFQQRLENLLNEEGVAYDVVNAIRQSSLRQSSLVNAVRKARAIHGLRRETHFHGLLAGYHRAANILRSAMEKAGKKPEIPVVDEHLFVQPAENELYQAVLQAEEKVKALVEQGDYHGALAELSTLTEPIDAFFTAVMVMDPDENIRNNRMALLNRIVAMSDAIADLREIVED